MRTCIFMHGCAHVQGRVLNYNMIFIVGISSTYAYVLTCFRLYMSTCMVVMIHYCVISTAHAIMIVQLETIVITTIKPIILVYMYIHIWISKLNLCISNHKTCDLSPLFLGLFLMVASTTKFHLKPLWKSPCINILLYSQLRWRVHHGNTLLPWYCLAIYLCMLIVLIQNKHLSVCLIHAGFKVYPF